MIVGLTDRPGAVLGVLLHSVLTATVSIISRTRAGTVTHDEVVHYLYDKNGYGLVPVTCSRGSPASKADLGLWSPTHSVRTKSVGLQLPKGTFRTFSLLELGVYGFSGNFPHLNNFLREDRSSKCTA